MRRRRADQAGASRGARRQPRRGAQGLSPRLLRLSVSTQAGDAQAGLSRLQTVDTLPADRFKQELARAERMFAAKRWAQARAAFEPLARVATGDDKELIALRLAECDYYLDRFRAAREALRPVPDKASRQAEARFFYLMATRALGDRADLRGAWPARWSTSSPTAPGPRKRSTTSPRTTSSSTTTTGRCGVPRAVQPLPAEPVCGARGLEDRLVRVPRRASSRKRRRCSKRRPPLSRAPTTVRRGCTGRGAPTIRWANAPTATERYRARRSPTTRTPTTAAWRRSIAGRPAASRRSIRQRRRRAAARSRRRRRSRTRRVIRALVGLELYDDGAAKKLQYAQRVWGDSPAVEATIAWIRTAGAS